MLDVWNRVIENIVTAEKDTCQNIVSVNNDSPSEFPALLVSQTDNQDAAVDLENSENAIESVIELQSYSNKNLTEARKIMAVACDAMRQMGFRRRMGPQQVQNAAAANVFRMAARFERLVGSGEEIEKFEGST